MGKVRLGMIGLGGIANGVHLPGYMKLDNCELVAICDIDESKLKATGDKYSIPEDRRYTDYRELIACDDIDAVDIATWNSVHCEIAKAAALAGKHFSVEKPVGMNYAEAYDLAKTAENMNVQSFICLSWRYHPYTRYVKYLVSSGKVGRLYHIYVRCIKDSGLWKGRKLEWRFDKTLAASGVLGDLGSHMIDIVRFWGQEFKDVYANYGTFITHRPTEDTGEIREVTTDDWCNMNCVLESDVSCTIELTRCATTVPNLISFEVYGEKGKLIYTNDEYGQKIEFRDAETREIELLTPPDEFTAMQSKSFIDLVQGIEDDYTAKITHGLECQAVIDAAIRSCEQHRPVTIAEIKEEIEK
ncbi:MAG: Gfo/Idh/MocA family oxidoreductase [Clostridiales bacterium]|nr:Gfo/Idh/MocA family oxidoreductase [Clostridiales bacterium]